MTAVERVVEYESVDPEDALEATGDRKPPPDWPQQGAIIFDKLSMRYFPDPASELVLKELDFDILPSEKVRTGYLTYHSCECSKAFGYCFDFFLNFVRLVSLVARALEKVRS